MLIHKLKNEESIENFELLANQVVEGFITGMHQSPFHGFSVEFAEHRLYNKGESTRHIDWKIFAKTDKLYVKRFDEETNLRCHIIIDNSASMHYPESENTSVKNLNKIGFSAVAAAALMNILKRQRDAVGLSIYSDSYDFYTSEKGSERHHRRILETLEKLLTSTTHKGTETYKYLHEIAENLHRRSLIFLFTDMWQANANEEALFEALKHLKYNKHEVVLFHTYDAETELHFDFDNQPKRFIDVETGESINLYSENVKDAYQTAVQNYFKNLNMKCMQYQIEYVPVAIKNGFYSILSTYLLKREKMV
jgi:uncharacterized protein (DUF58 family)